MKRIRGIWIVLALLLAVAASDVIYYSTRTPEQIANARAKRVAEEARSREARAASWCRLFGCGPSEPRPDHLWYFVIEMRLIGKRGPFGTRLECEQERATYRDAAQPCFRND